jgi:biopolymer transport protein ExbD
MRRRSWHDKGVHVIMLHKDRSVELDNRRIDRSSLVDALVEKVRRNKKLINSKGRHKPRPTNVMIRAQNRLSFEYVLDFMELVQGTGARVVALNIPSFRKNTNCRV